MRLLAEIVVIAALIYFGWNTPFKERAAQANTTITNKLRGIGSKLQKHQDPFCTSILGESAPKKAEGNRNMTHWGL
jgi:hypothetical protein